MKQWSLQDIRPAPAGRGRGAERLYAAAPQERSRARRPVEQDMPEDEERDEREVYDEEDEAEEVRPARRPVSAAETEYVGQPLRRKMSLEPSPLRRYVKIGAGIAVLGSLVVAGSMHVAARASITIVPKVIAKDVSAQLTAAADGSSALPFAIVSKELQASTMVPAQGVQDVSEAAHGTITIYNEYSATAYPLVKNTRFESEGKIFRIQESVSVPGYTMRDGTLVPGTLQARVVAAEVGEAGNIAPTQFTVPGLKGGDEYAKIYARSTEAFAGGFVGKRARVADTDKASARTAMEEKLAEQLRAQILETQVADQIMYPAAAVITYSDDVEAVPDSTTQATYVVRGTIRVPVFSAEALSSALAEASGERGDGETYRLAHPEALTFAYATPVAALDEHTVITFSLAGPAVLVAQVPREEFAKALVGAATDDVHSIVTKYPAIDRITYTISVPWKRSFPTNPDRVTIDVVVPEK